MTVQDAKHWVLTSARADLAHLLTLVGGEAYYSTRRADNPEKFAIYDAEKRAIVAYDPRGWMGRPLDTAESKACSRALAELEGEGLIERINGGGRTVAIRLLGERAKNTGTTELVPETSPVAAAPGEPEPEAGDR